MPRAAATRLAAAQLFLLAASAPSLDPEPPGDDLEIGGVRLRLLHHTSRLTEDGGFASWPFHLNGSIVTEADGRSWLYTSSQASGKWTTDVRSASLDPFTAAPNLGPTRRALNGTAADRWATMHLVLRGASAATAASRASRLLCLATAQSPRSGTLLLATESDAASTNLHSALLARGGWKELPAPEAELKDPFEHGFDYEPESAARLY